MGLPQSHLLQSAIKSDGLPKIKKAAFTQLAILTLQPQTHALKQYISAVLQQKLLLQTQFIYQQKDVCGGLLNSKVNEIAKQDPDLIDQLQKKFKKSFREMTGYRKVIEGLEKVKNRAIKAWNAETVKFLSEVQVKSQQLKQKLLKETPQTPALDKLQPELKQKALNKFINDDAYEIQKEQYTSWAIQQLQKIVDLDNVLETRFKDELMKQEVTKIVQGFRQSLEESEYTGEGCPCEWGLG